MLLHVNTICMIFSADPSKGYYYTFRQLSLSYWLREYSFCIFTLSSNCDVISTNIEIYRYKKVPCACMPHIVYFISRKVYENYKISSLWAGWLGHTCRGKGTNLWLCCLHMWPRHEPAFLASRFHKPKKKKPIEIQCMSMAKIMNSCFTT